MRHLCQLVAHFSITEILETPRQMWRDKSIWKKALFYVLEAYYDLSIKKT